MKEKLITNLDDLAMVCDTNFRRIIEGVKRQGKINKRNKKALICAFISLYLLNVQTKHNATKIKKLEKELDELRHKGVDEEV